LRPLNAEVAQLVERNLAKVEVASSSLVFRSKAVPLPGAAFFRLYDFIQHPFEGLHEQISVLS